jgi:hypothetical protein
VIHVRGRSAGWRRIAESRAIKAVIDRVCPLERIVEAHRCVETDHKRGNVVITVA